MCIEVAFGESVSDPIHSAANQARSNWKIVSVGLFTKLFICFVQYVEAF